MRGSEVIEPWPISAPVLRIVTVPSGTMRTQAFSGFAAFASEIPGNVNAKARPPLTLKKSLRSMSGLLRRALDRGDDAVVGAAAADVAVHMTDDLGACGFGLRLEELGGLHDLPRLAVAALRHFLGDPRFLQGMRGIRG